MEEGAVEGDASLDPASICWIGSGSEGEEELAPIPFWRFSSSPRFHAFRCSACGILEVEYGEGTLKG